MLRKISSRVKKSLSRHGNLQIELFIIKWVKNDTCNWNVSRQQEPRIAKNISEYFINAGLTYCRHIQLHLLNRIKITSIKTAILFTNNSRPKRPRNYET